MNKETILNAMKWRYATKTFIPTEIIPEDIVQTILEVGRLSPSAYGLEPWHFFVIKNKELRTSLRAAGYDQSKITDASHLIVIATRTDGKKVVSELIERTAKNQGKSVDDLKGYSDMVTGSVDALGEEGTKNWYKMQSYIPLGIMIETAALLSIDAGPMEGFNADAVDELLNLKEMNLRTTTMLALGKRGDDAYAMIPKTRKEYTDVITTIE